MDQRLTFTGIDELLTLITALHKQQAKVSMLVDDNGLVRKEGVIAELKEEEGRIIGIVIGGETVLLKKIVGVNGIFGSDYTEC